MPALRTAPVATPPAVISRTAAALSVHPASGPAAPVSGHRPATLVVPENAIDLLRDSIAALIAMDRDRLQALAARALRAERQRGWQRMTRREQATFLAERQLLEALLEETRRNLRLFRGLSAAQLPPQRAVPNGQAYAATGALWAD